MSGKDLIVIEAKPTTFATRISELFKYRAFYPFLVREITMKKWKNTILGFWWLIIRPMVPTALAIVTFTVIAPIDSHGVPYAIFYLSGFIVWNMLQATLLFIPRTLLWMQSVIRKTYFPRLLIPFASVGPPAIELCVAIAAFLVACVYYVVSDGTLYLRIGPAMLLSPVCILLALLLGLAIGMVASVIALFARDIVFTMGYVAQVWMFLTPVLYPITMVPEGYRWIVYILNPAAAIIEANRWALTGHGVVEPVWLAVSGVTTAAFFLASCWFFVRAEPVVLDTI